MRVKIAIFVAVFALMAGVALPEDLDLRTIQTEIAAHEARLKFLEANIGSSHKLNDNVADSLISINKNATVTIGGTLNTRYFARIGKVSRSKHRFVPIPASKTRTQIGDFRVDDALLNIKVDVNEHLEAWVQIDMQPDYKDASREVQQEFAAGHAKQYWVRWKNICNTGFGVLVGRGDLVFGDGGYGVITSWTGGHSSSLKNAFPGGTILYSYNGWDRPRTTQVTPYWESHDGRFKAEVSFIQGIDELDYTRNGKLNGWVSFTGWDGNTPTYRSHNYGLGSMTARVTVMPITGLKLSISALNLYVRNLNATGGFQEGIGYWLSSGPMTTKFLSSTNSAVDLAFQYRPYFFNRLNIWAQYIHGWNEGFIRDRDSDAANFGASYDITDRLTAFAQGDFIRIKANGQATIGDQTKTRGWAYYTGLRYRLPHGFDLESGWRHDRVTHTGGAVDVTFRADTIYGHLGFTF